MSEEEPPRVLYDNGRLKFSLNWRSPDGDVYSFDVETYLDEEPQNVRQKLERMGGQTHTRIQIDGFYEIEGIDTVSVEGYVGSNRKERATVVEISDYESSADHEKVKGSMQGFVTRASELLMKLGSDEDKSFYDKVLPDLLKVSKQLTSIPPKEGMSSLVY